MRVFQGPIVFQIVATNIFFFKFILTHQAQGCHLCPTDEETMPRLFVSGPPLCEQVELIAKSSDSFWLKGLLAFSQYQSGVYTLEHWMMLNIFF